MEFEKPGLSVNIENITEQLSVTCVRLGRYPSSHASYEIHSVYFFEPVALWIKNVSFGYAG